MGFSIISVIIYTSSYCKFGVSMGVAVCGGVVQCGAVCCSVLQSAQKMILESAEQLSMLQAAIL